MFFLLNWDWFDTSKLVNNPEIKYVMFKLSSFTSL